MRLLIFLLAVLMFGCDEPTFFTSVVVQVENKSEGMYYLAESHDWDLYYTSNTNESIKLPKLPYGFTLRYKTAADSLYLIEGYPYLFHELARTGLDYGYDNNYPIYNIEQLYVANHGIYIKSADSDVIWFINYESPDVLDLVTKRDFTYNRFIEFHYVKGKEYKENFVSNSIGIQDAAINKQYNWEISTPIIGGIVKLSMVDAEHEYVFVGQTIYSYFIFYPKTGKVEFLLDEAEYKAFIRDNFYSGNMWESSYLYESEKKMSEFVNYTITPYIDDE